MADVTCEVIKDLIPLYVDDVLSEDSKALVEEHLNTCEKCAEYCKDLKEAETVINKNKNSRATEAIKKIKSRINLRRVVAIVVTAVSIISVLGGLWYWIFIHEHFVPYEKAGIYVKNDAIYAECARLYGRWTFTPDGKVCFYYLSSTLYRDWEDNKFMKIMPVIELTEEALNAGNYAENCEEIYYVPDIKTWNSIKWNDDNIEGQVEDLKSVSYLIWSAD